MRPQSNTTGLIWLGSRDLDPAAKKFLDMIGAANAPDLSQLSPAEMRERFPPPDAPCRCQKPAVGRIDDGELPGDAGPLPSVSTRRMDAPVSACRGLSIFTGVAAFSEALKRTTGFAACSPMRAVAASSQWDIGSLPNIDSRPGPTTAMPRSTGVFGQASALAIDPDRIAVGGNSAGGGLAATVCQRASRGNGPSIALQLLLCPVLDLARESESRRSFPDGYFLDQATIDWMIRHYCPPVSISADPRAVAATHRRRFGPAADPCAYR